jgi:hypothetical protein
VRGSVKLASPVDVERSPFIFKAMGKEAGLTVTKMFASVRRKGKLITLEEK